MQILAHRGFWTQPSEKNTLAAFENAWAYGFGIETDVRCFNGKLVIAHDIPNGFEMTVEHFFDAYIKKGNDTILALNIKEDGLQDLLQECLVSYHVQHFFVFDMSIPDTLGYLRRSFPLALRLSEYEKKNALYPQVDYIWLDAFKDERWIKLEGLFTLLRDQKKIAIVSPELHKREHLTFWNMLKIWNIHRNSNVCLCTDFPKIARTFFDE